MATDTAGGLPPGVASRLAAYKALRRVQSTGAWSVHAVDSALATANLDARDRAFAASLAYETLRWQGTLDWALRQVLTRPLEGVQPELVDLLRLGAWQLLRAAVPDAAAVGTAAEVARRQVGPQATGFVNGVLRGLARRKDALAWPPEDTDAGLALALGYPEWVVAEARKRFGDRARAVLEAGNASPGVTLRAVGDRDALIAELRAEGVDAEPGTAAPEAVRAPGANPGLLRCVAEGRAAVQDEASMLVARAVMAGVGSRDPGPPMVLDVAAAPGGKAAHMAQLGAWVVAGDLRERRARLIRDAARRLGVAHGVAVLSADGLRPPWRGPAFDAVLLDAPCSGLGVTRRRPEVRWRGADDVSRLAELQFALLESAARAVTPGGLLVYSACTWTRAETLDVVAAFLAAHGDRFTPAPLGGALGGAGSVLGDDPGIQLLPDRDGTDGMYVCAFGARNGT